MTPTTKRPPRPATKPAPKRETAAEQGIKSGQKTFSALMERIGAK